MHNSPQPYRPPALPTYAQRRAEKERQLAIAAGQLAGTRGDDGYRERNDGLQKAVDNSSSEQKFKTADPGHASRPVIALSCVPPVNRTDARNDFAMQGIALTEGNHPGQLYPDHAASRRPLPSPAKAVSTICHSPSSVYARDRQRSLPQPSPATMRTMPSMPALRNCLPSSASAVEQILPSHQASLVQPEGQALARHASTPCLQGGFARRLPNPPSVPRLMPFSELPAESDGVPSAMIPARSRALPMPGHTPGRPASIQGMDRSDTVSSIKSLDRWEMTRHARSSNSTASINSPNARPLPLPQVLAAKSGLAPSRSLDRGMPRYGGFLGMSNTTTSRTSAVRPATRPIVTSFSNLPTAPSAEQIFESQLNGSTSSTSLDERQPCQISADGGLGTVEEVVDVGEGQGSDRSAPTRKEVPVFKIAPPVIVCPDTPEVPKLSVTPAMTPSLPGVSVDHPESPREPSPEIDSATNVIVDCQVPSVIISGGSVPSVSHTVTAQPALKALSISSPPSANHSGPGIFCSACDLVILGSIINAAGKRWHPDCLRCTTCGVGLEHVSRYDHDGMPYCHMDYHEQFAPKCHHCNTPIVDQRYITIDDVSLGQRFYHELHFFCGECGIPFLDPSRSSAAGTEKRTGEGNSQGNIEDDDQTAAFVIHGKYAFCPDCDIKLHRVKCKRCKLPIKDLDQALKALGHSWHKECFKCASCQQPIPTQHFVPINRKPYCQECYTAS